MATATYDLIASQALVSAAASITFSSIAASWTDLRVVMTGTISAAGNVPLLNFNNISTTTYSQTELYGNGASAGVSANTSNTFIYLGYQNSWSTTIPSFNTIDIFSYANSSYKTVLATTNEDANGLGMVLYDVGLWRSTAAITSVNLSLSGGNYAIGTIASLYGIKAA